MSGRRCGPRHRPLVEADGVLLARRQLTAFRLDVLVPANKLQARLGEHASGGSGRLIAPCGDPAGTQLVEAKSHDLDCRLGRVAAPPARLIQRVPEAALAWFGI